MLSPSSGGAVPIDRDGKLRCYMHIERKSWHHNDMNQAKSEHL
jgi:hypothetical protein